MTNRSAPPAKTRRAGESYRGDLRRALLDAAITSHAQGGYDALSLRAVARAVGVSHAAPAHHFGDKAGLLTAIAVEGFELLKNRMDQVSQTKGDIEATLRALGLAYVGFASSSPAHYEAMFRPSLIHHDDERFIAASDAAYKEMVQMVHTFQASGWRQDTDTLALATALWSLIHGLCSLKKERSLVRRHPNASPEALVEIAMALILVGPAR